MKLKYIGNLVEVLLLVLVVGPMSKEQGVLAITNSPTTTPASTSTTTGPWSTTITQSSTGLTCSSSGILDSLLLTCIYSVTQPAYSSYSAIGGSSCTNTERDKFLCGVANFITDSAALLLVNSPSVPCTSQTSMSCSCLNVIGQNISNEISSSCLNSICLEDILGILDNLASGSSYACKSSNVLQVCGSNFIPNLQSCQTTTAVASLNVSCDQDTEVLVSNAGQMSCHCKSGYKRNPNVTPAVCEDINECTSGQHICIYSTENCINTNGSYYCSCKSGAFNETQCKDISMCTYYGTCPYTTGICVNTTDVQKDCRCYAYYYSVYRTSYYPDAEGCFNGSINCATPIWASINGYGPVYCVCSDTRREINNTTYCADVDECRNGNHNCDMTTQSCYNTVGSHYCSCRSGFTYSSGNPINCTDIDECISTYSRCPNSDEVCVNTMGSYRCDCKSGYNRVNRTRTCRDIEEYVNITYGTYYSMDPVCLNPSNGIQKCNCFAYAYSGSVTFRGTNDSVCTDINECLEDRKNCSSAFYGCINGFGYAYCYCSTNGVIYGPSMIESTCEVLDVDECTNGNHTCDLSTSSCVNTIGSFNCSCNEGYEVTSNTSQCKDIDECTRGTHTCGLTVAECINTIGSFRCVCKDGYISATSVSNNTTNCTDINECNSNNHTCDLSTTTCVNTIGSFACNCKQGYEKIGNSTQCTDIDECTRGTYTCNLAVTVCKNTVGSFQCDCKAGYSFNSALSNNTSNCTDINECNTNNHTCDLSTSTCVNTIGSFACNCIQGYEQIGNTTQCTDTNECATSGLNDCDNNNGKCVNLPGSYRCECHNGYTGVNNTNNTCIDVNECTLMTDSCDKGNGTCNNIVGSYVCQCNSGYKLKTDGVSCTAFDACDFGTHNCDTINGFCFGEDGAYECKCNPGYQLPSGGGNCTDVDECSVGSHTCDAFRQVCLNTLGSYKCHCKNGYEESTNYGYGVTVSSVHANSTNCTDINECSSGSHNCSTIHGFCTNTEGSYKCGCNEGYQLLGDGLSCTDFDECKNGSDKCDKTNGQCSNTFGSYKCSCKPGFVLSSDGYTCKAPKLIPYGTNNGDEIAFTSADRKLTWSNYWYRRTYYAKEIKIPTIALLSDNFCKRCYLGISSTGYVTLRTKRSKVDGDMYVRRWPSEWIWAFNWYRRRQMQRFGLYVLAPFWADTNYIIGHNPGNEVYYQLYKRRKAKKDERVRSVLDNVNERVQRYTGDDTFDASFVAVVTWANMVPPRGYGWWWWWGTSYDASEKNTFQLVLATDRKKSMTYVMYLYEDIAWKTGRAVHIGYYLQSPKYRSGIKDHTETAFSNLYWPYKKTLTYQVDTTYNPLIDETGTLFYTLAGGSTSLNYDELCLEWYEEEMEQTPTPYWGARYGWNTPRYLQFVDNWSWLGRACPCDVRAARDDWRWRRDRWEKKKTGKKCFVQRWSWWYTARTCCYEQKKGNLITAEDGTGGHTYLFHPQWWWTKGWYMQYDDPYKEYCCEQSNNCDKYYEIRPNDDCSSYRPPRFGWFSGDPHITTLDTHKYTFNGLGEYVLIQTPASNFTLQGRTGYALDENGNDKAATVFTAFVAKDNGGDPVQVEFDGTRTGINLHALDTNLTDWFNSAADDDDNSNFVNVAITRTTNTSVTATYDSGFSMTVAAGEGQLTITISAPEDFKEKTAGLLGVYNGDITDDYTDRDGNVLAITAPESLIYTDFGEKWRTSENESIFIYHDDQTHATFVPTSYTPVFLDVLKQSFTDAEWQSFNTTCSGNTECMFDLAVTGNQNLAALTLQTDQNNLAVSENMANARPQISVDSIFNVTFQQAAELTYQVTDNDIGDNTSLSINFTRQSDSVDVSSELTVATNKITWTPTTIDEVSLLLSAEDSKGGVSPEITVRIRFCECPAGQGVCDFGDVREDQNPTSAFAFVECQCITGWSALDPENCSDKISLRITQVHFNGLDCSEDIDGCLDNSCGCNVSDVCTGSKTVCYDVPAANDTIEPGGAFTCGPCNSGYEKRDGDDTNDCINVDECNNGTNECDTVHGTCADSDGSYDCGCVSGYRLHLNGRNCTDIDECVEGTSGCAHLCNNTDGSFICVCETGYTLNADNKTCTLDPSIEALCNSSGCDYCRGPPISCFCPNGYQLAVNNLNCIDKDECQTAADNICDAQTSTCNNTAGSYECDCNTGYVIQTDKRTCKECEDGYWGDGCSSICRCLIGTNCSLATGCTQCSDSGLTGGNCDQDIDECLTNPCGSYTSGCVNTYGSYRCTCESGYERMNQTDCQDINNCTSTPCLNGALCTNDPGYLYTCDCVSGYTGTHCETDINECASNPCQNGGYCDDQLNKYRCTCTQSYYGVRCENARYELATDVPNVTVVIQDSLGDSGESSALSQTILIALGAGASGLLAIVVIGTVIIYKSCFSKPKKQPEGKAKKKKNKTKTNKNKAKVNNYMENQRSAPTQPTKSNQMSTNGVGNSKTGAAAGGFSTFTVPPPPETTGPGAGPSQPGLRSVSSISLFQDYNSEKKRRGSIGSNTGSVGRQSVTSHVSDDDRSYAAENYRQLISQVSVVDF